MASEKDDFSFESSYFLSAPPSPCNLDPHHALSFYTLVPPNPNQDSDHDHLDFQFNNTSSGGGEGFITASTFEESPKKKRGLHRCAESLPSVSFADELFCDGKVKALPPPPGCRSPVPSPRSPLSRMNNLWSDDFDPFVAALESVKEDSHRRNTKKNHRRAQSASPFDGPGHRHQQEEVVPKSPVQEKLAEPKGVDFSRRLRQVKTLGNNGDNGRKTKKQKMMRFLTMRGKSLEKEEDRESQGSNRRMNGLLRRLSFNRSRSSSSSSSETENKKKKTKTVAMAVSTASATRNGSRAVTKVPVMQYRPRLLLCLGYGLRRSSYIKSK